MKPKTRNPFLILPIAALVAGAATLAAAAPSAPAPSAPASSAPDPASSGFHVQVTAGHGRLGVSVLQVSRELRAHLGAPSDRGVLVDAVRADSPAARAGVRVGDVILEVDGDPATSATGMLNAMADRKKGDALAITLLRDRKQLALTATLADDPGPRLRRFGATGDRFDLDLDTSPLREMLRGGAFGRWQRQLDEARRRIEELEQRLEELERS